MVMANRYEFRSRPLLNNSSVYYLVSNTQIKLNSMGLCYRLAYFAFIYLFICTFWEQFVVIVLTCDCDIFGGVLWPLCVTEAGVGRYPLQENTWCRASPTSAQWATCLRLFLQHSLEFGRWKSNLGKGGLLRPAKCLKLLTWSGDCVNNFILNNINIYSILIDTNSTWNNNDCAKYVTISIYR